ncbi:hypothetical protein F4677DRAFT_293409 [Hypoxylon crocopeplum]|nr:hypothetical protein F4677DRAFT_293409 [Hypoxylon crocopeplum]
MQYIPRLRRQNRRYLSLFSLILCTSSEKNYDFKAPQSAFRGRIYLCLKHTFYFPIIGSRRSQRLLCNRTADGQTAPSLPRRSLLRSSCRLEKSHNAKRTRIAG